MKTILLLVSLVFTGMALGSCTNDESEDLDLLTPQDEEETQIEGSIEKN